jgi:hypothetical protein
MTDENKSTVPLICAADSWYTIPQSGDKVCTPACNVVRVACEQDKLNSHHSHSQKLCSARAGGSQGIYGAMPLKNPRLQVQILYSNNTASCCRDHFSPPWVR